MEIDGDNQTSAVKTKDIEESLSLLEEKQNWANRGKKNASPVTLRSPTTTSVPTNNHATDKVRASPSATTSTSNNNQSVLEQKRVWTNRRGNGDNNDTTATTVGAVNICGDDEEGFLDRKNRISNFSYNRKNQRNNNNDPIPEPKIFLSEESESRTATLAHEKTASAHLVEAELVLESDNDTNNKENDDEMNKKERKRMEAEIREQIQKEVVQAEAVAITDELMNKKQTENEKRLCTKRNIGTVIVVLVVAIAAFVGGTVTGARTGGILWSDTCIDAPIKEGPNITVFFGRLNATIDENVNSCGWDITNTWKSLYNTIDANDTTTADDWYYATPPDKYNKYNLYFENSSSIAYRGVWSRIKGTGKTMSINYTSTDDVASVFVYSGTDCNNLTCLHSTWLSSENETYYLFVFVLDSYGIYNGNVSLVVE